MVNKLKEINPQWIIDWFQEIAEGIHHIYYDAHEGEIEFDGWFNVKDLADYLNNKLQGLLLD